MGTQFLEFFSIGSHGQHPRVDRPGAPDVVWRVAHHQDLSTRQFHAQSLAAAPSGHRRNLVPVLVIVAKATDGKPLPQIMSAQLDFRAPPDVPVSNPIKGGCGRVSSCRRNSSTPGTNSPA